MVVPLHFSSSYLWPVFIGQKIRSAWIHMLEKTWFVYIVQILQIILGKCGTCLFHTHFSSNWYLSSTIAMDLTKTPNPCSPQNFSTHPYEALNWVLQLSHADFKAIAWIWLFSQGGFVIEHTGWIFDFCFNFRESWLERTFNIGWKQIFLHFEQICVIWPNPISSTSGNLTDSL